MISADQAARISAAVREDEIVAMCSDVINIPSPTGDEGEMGRYMRQAMEATGLSVSWQEVEEGRANVVGRWEGAGHGKCLMFNGHMDTSNSGSETFLTGLGYKPHAMVANGMIFGLGIYNMKGALVCYLQAVRALQRAGVRPAGDVLIAAVVGEIEKSQWDEEFVGKQFRGYGAGTHYLVNHGIMPDMCILGEPTDMDLVLGHCGSVWVRISTHGPYVHTAFSRGLQQEHAIRRMHDVLQAIFEWIPKWEAIGAYGEDKGLVNIGGIHSGHAWRASRTPPSADVYLDVRVPPHLPLGEARGHLEELVHSLRSRFPAYGITWETYVSVPGAEIPADHELVAAVERSHRQVTGRAPRRTTVSWSSDASVMSRYGIASLNYGPSSGPRDEQGEKVAIEVLVAISTIYALAIVDLCGEAA